MPQVDWKEAPLEIMKFGGTSVRDITHIRNVAARIKSRRDAGNRILVVVSAMAGVTDQLVDYCNQLDTCCSARHHVERDVVISSGEQVTSGLLALTLTQEGVPAQSFQGWQVPLCIDRKTGGIGIPPKGVEFLLNLLENGTVVVVSGFQGIDPTGAVATLGRGGSDASAVILAAALNAQKCDIYTDVDGVYTADPRKLENAKHLPSVEFGEMLELSSAGAKVLQVHSVALAMKCGVDLKVLSSHSVQGEFSDKGTRVVKRADFLEGGFNASLCSVTSVVASEIEAKFSFDSLPSKSAHRVVKALAGAGVSLDMLALTPRAQNCTLSFSVPAPQEECAFELLKSTVEQPARIERNLRKISIVGIGVRTDGAILETLSEILDRENIVAFAICCSEMRIAVLVDADRAQDAVGALHTAFGLQNV